MPDEPQKPRRVPLGTRMSREELDAMADVGPGDLELAKDRWRKHVPREYRDLLDAEPTE